MMGGCSRRRGVGSSLARMLAVHGSVVGAAVGAVIGAVRRAFVLALRLAARRAVGARRATAVAAVAGLTKKAARVLLGAVGAEAKVA